MISFIHLMVVLKYKHDHQIHYICPVPARSRWATPPKPGSAQGFFLLVREFFLATVALGLL